MTIAQPRAARGVTEGGEFRNRERRDTAVRLGICRVDGCENPSRTPGSALCNKHYARMRNHGTTDLPPGSRVLDWSKPQHCRECKAEMAPFGKQRGDKVTHERDGLCRRCCWGARAQENGTAKNYVQFDEEGQTCTKCLRYQPYSEFVKQAEMLSGYRSHCRTCSLLYKAGLTRDEYDAIYESQNGRCRICQQSDAIVGRLFIDHDHNCCPTGTKRNCGKCTRGLLCGRCNSGLGFFLDNPEALIQAAAYLSNNLYTERNDA